MSRSASAPPSTDFAVIGAGIVGLATARELSLRHPDATIAVFERERRVGAHQTGHSSDVIHSGIYYKPGSLKARLCVEGARRLYEYCAEHGVEARPEGKLVVATGEDQLGRLDELERRARANDVPGLERIGSEQISEIEPACRGVAALFSPAAGVTSFAAVAEAIAAELADRGVAVAQGCRVDSLTEAASEVKISHEQGTTSAGAVVSCAGGWVDRLAEGVGAPAEPRIIPFRGAFAEIAGRSAGLVRQSIYPVPDPDLPFLGAHLTRGIDGRVLAGPTALVAGAPGAHERQRFEARSLARTLAWAGTYRLGARQWRAAATELAKAVTPRRLARELRRMVPDLDPGDIRPAGGGVRAQAINRDGTVVDDFVVFRTAHTVHVRNAPSPAATSCLPLAELIADELEGRA